MGVEEKIEPIKKSTTGTRFMFQMLSGDEIKEKQMQFKCFLVLHSFIFDNLMLA